MSGRGRGWYYKQKYGGGGRGGGGGGGGRGEGRHQPDGSTALAEGDDDAEEEMPCTGDRTGNAQELADILRRIDGRGYKAYNDIRGRWTMQNGAFILCIDHVQSDPYAAPSRCHIEVPASVAQLPLSLWETRVRRIATCDYLTRSFAQAVATARADIRAQAGGWSGEKGGEMEIDAGGQHVLERTSVLIRDRGDVEARFTVALPARGRTVLGRWAADILIRNLPQYVEKGLHYRQQDQEALSAHVCCVEDTQALRDALPRLGLIGFVGNGAILPRASGASDKPFPSEQAVRFQSPPSLQVAVDLPNGGKVAGMGIRPGVTLVVGGGFHGKSTLLKALEAGVTNKVPGDGRELVVVSPDACKIRAEDGRRVEGVDISPFISNLPFGRATDDFRTEDASGSTSQAANIMEALEVGADVLLIDEDTTATNFMIRDARMQALVKPAKEPITPLVARIRSLALTGVSCILVVGGAGDYFEVADCVICMDCFQARDVTQQAHAIADQFGRTYTACGQEQAFGPVKPRVLVSLHPGNPNAGGKDFKAKARALDEISFGNETIDLGAVEQLFDRSQTNAVTEALVLLRKWVAQPQWRGKSAATVLAALDAEMERKGLDVLSPWTKPGNLARPRKHEIAAAVNRLRSLNVAKA